METQKILLSTNANAIAEFRKNVQGTCDAANNLIELFGLFQSYEVVTTLPQFEALLADPGGYYDEVILRHVKLDTGGRKPDLEVLASLVGLHRAEYLNAVGGLPLTSDDCEPCRRAKVKPGKRSISKHEFSAYQEYLTFDAGTFTVNMTAVDNDMDKFTTYATTEEEIEVVNLYNDLVKVLNEFTLRFPITPVARETVKTAFKLFMTEGHTGDFMVNPEVVKNAIQSLKYHKQ